VTPALAPEWHFIRERPALSGNVSDKWLKSTTLKVGVTSPGPFRSRLDVGGWTLEVGRSIFAFSSFRIPYSPFIV